MTYQTDVVIVGAGPVGLFAIFECGMLRLKCHVIDTLDAVGGQCAALYPEKPIYDIPAYPKVTGAELVENLHQQCLPFNPTFHLGHQVTSVEQLDEAGKSWRVITSKGAIIECKSIIIAAGVGAFGPNRPPLDNIEQFEGHSIHYYVKSREAFKNKHVVIAGGGDSAVDWALSLSEIAASVSVVHRRPKFRAAPESEARLNELATQGQIRLITPYQLEGLEGNDNQLTHVIVKSMDGEIQSLRADYLLAFFGLSMNLGPIAEWGLGLEKSHISINPLTAATNRPGVYAIGDIATYDHKLKLILTGFAEAAQAAHAIRHFLYPDEIIHFEYSTTKGIQAA
ncbi:NAD(P)/FAD-dependent oxidoreductase [Candidatus Paracaedibacter symbiosus]|uniref:NAD(P)/FAD-dependent oxidoreductase n=1 Tax=Candidatus Paracaedibacter symbiosus TaxID=244582 RepID=UPI000509FC67|nr:NAD(P)/FAD-dependent oxidoreductase [Candidatus Paracaedibacter symbiosus]